jgi:hypothetical protein
VHLRGLWRVSERVRVRIGAPARALRGSGAEGAIAGHIRP